MSNPGCSRSIQAAHLHPRAAALILFLALLACSPIPVFVPTPVPTVVIPMATAALPVSTPTPPSVPTATAIPNLQSPIPNTQYPISSAIPTLITEIDLGVRLELSLLHSVALDLEGGHVFVGVPGQQTLVLSADDLRVVETLNVGGDVAIDHTRTRLYVGAPSGVAVFDLDSLQPMGRISITAYPYGSTPVVDESIGSVFIVQDGVYVVDPMTLDVTARISGTFPSIGSLSSPRAVDAAFDATRRLVYVSLNNGIPGSNNGNTLLVHDLRTREIIYRDDERSVVSLAADEKSGRVFVARSRLNTHSLAALHVDRSPITTEWHVKGIAGSIQVDTQRGRVYVADSRGPSPRLLTLNMTIGALIADVPLPRAYTLAAFDVETDQLYLISPDGHLMVMRGHGATPPAPETIQPSTGLTGTVAWIAPSPNYIVDKTLFAAWTSERPSLSAGQLMFSTIGSGPLSRVSGGLPQHLLVNALAFSPDFARDKTLFAALIAPDSRGGGLYVSNDAGRSWRPTTNGLSDWGITELAVAIGPAANHIVFALTAQDGLFRSIDGGETWTRMTYRASSPTALGIQTLAVSPNFAEDKLLVFSLNNNTSISRDGGDTWRTVMENRAVSLVFSRKGTLLGSFADAGVLRSTDGGETWQAASRGLRLDTTSRVTLALSPDFDRDRTALALVRSAAQTALYRTADGGASWQIETTNKTPITAIAFAPDGSILLGASDGQVRATSLSDLKWANASASLDKLTIEAMALSPDYARDRTLFIGNGRAGVFVSNDGGRRWAEANLPARDSGANKLLLAISPGYANDKIVYAATAGQVFRSEDGGASWQSLMNGLGNFFPAASLAISPQFASDRTLLIGGSFRAPRVMRSTDGGETWNVTAGLLLDQSIQAIAFVPGASRVAYAWVEQGGLYRSGDGGATWARVFNPPPARSFSLQSLGISPDFTRDRLMFASALGSQSIYRSADGGAGWHPADSGLPQDLALGSALAVSPDFARDRLVLLGTDRGVFRSEDGGMTWKPSSVGLPQAMITSLAISPGWAADRTVYAGLAERGLYISTDGGLTWRPAR